MRLPLISHPSALLRSPLLPVETLLTQLPKTDDETVATLRSWLSRPVVEQALQIASPTLHQVWLRWKESPAQLPTEAAQLALWRYVLRMGSRATPFGLFAGVSLASVGAQTIGAVERDAFETRVRPDSAWLSALAEQLGSQPEIRSALRYQVNNSLYRLGNQLRYSDYTLQAGQRAFFLNSVVRDEALDAVIDYVQSKPEGVPGHRIVDFLVETVGEDPVATQALVDELIECHILISELEPTVTQDNAFGQLLNRLATLPTAGTWLSVLTSIRNQLGEAAAAKQIELDTAQQMRAVVGEGYTDGDVCQVDMVRPSESVTLKSAVVEQIGWELLELAPLRSDPETSALRTFARRFYDRYGQQAQPLLRALDHEAGIGYGSTLPRTGELTMLQALSRESKPGLPSADRLDQLRLAKLTEFLKTGETIQPITETDLKAVAGTVTGRPLARSWAVLGELYGTDAGTIDAGQYRFLVKSVTGPTAASLMARFGSQYDELASQLRQLTDWEQQQHPEALLAEIAHLPAGRVGNVLQRPVLRTYEIPYVTPAGVDSAHTLLLNDLWVRTEDGVNVELWSQQHNRRILPRNTTAHNYHGSDDVYRFLTDLSHQDEAFSLRWSWGFLAEQPRFPRLMFKHLIVARAQWNLINQPHWLSADCMAEDLQGRLSVPRLILLVEGDHELLLDLSSPPCRQILFAELNKRTTVRLVEWLGGPEQCWLSRAGKRFTSELILPFGIRQAPPLSHTSPFQFDTQQVQRTFGPGSEWLYVKVYVGELTANEVLTQVVEPLVSNAQEQQWIDQWFFIRYYDPEPHLRLRFHCSGQTYSFILNELNRRLAPWISDERVRSVQVDTYERELERYGHAAISLVEQLFWQDSVWILLWIEQSAEFDEDLHWWVACQRADQLLEAFGLTQTEKQDLMGQLQANFLKENEERKSLRKELNQQYREWLKRLEHQSLPSLPSVECASIIAQIRYVRERSQDGQPVLPALLRSLLHMQCNRFFTSSQRMSEGVVYHFLLRRYMTSTVSVLTK